VVGAAAFGGGVYNANTSLPALINCTFSGNSAQNGGGVSNQSSTPTLTNCILWADTATEGEAEIHDVSSTPTVAYSCAEGGYNDGTNGATMVTGPPAFVGLVQSGAGTAVDYEAGETVLTHNGAFTADGFIGMILWVDLDNDDTVDTPFPIAANDADTITVYGDASATTTFIYEAWDYRLDTGSPCVDTGADTSGDGITEDMDGLARPQDGLGDGQLTGDGSDYDMGAYEYVAP
jgi:hypothetical protein